MWSAWSKLPSMATTRAPAISAWQQLAERDLALGQDDDDVEAGVRAVRRRGGRRVAGRRADDGPRPGLDGLGDGHDHAAVLERPGRVLALDLEVQVRGADGRPEPLGAHERRRALAEGQRRGRVGHGQERGDTAPSAAGRALAAAITASVIDGVERDVDAVGQDGGERGLRLGQGHDLAADGRAVLEPDRGGLVERGRERPRPGPRAGRRTSDAGRRAGRRPRRRGRSPPAGRPTSNRSPRAIARRSPRTALLVAGPPAPGPDRPTVPSGSASISMRFVTPSVQPKGLSAGTAVGMTDASMAPPRRVAVASSLIVRPERRRSLELLVGDAGDAGLAVAARRRRPAPDASPDPATARTRAGRGSRAC